MKSKFSEIVSKYLFTYGSVGIPGIGTFLISESSSGFKLENDILSPPTRMVDFSEDITDEEGLVKYLKANHGYSRKDAEKKISEYSKKFLNDLLNYGVANIPGIGRLSKYANGEIVFDPAKEYLITTNYMLPELKLTPLSGIASTSEKVTPKVVTPTPPKASPVVPVAAALAVPSAATAEAFLGDKTTPKPEPKVVKPTPVEKPAIVKKDPSVEVKKEVKPVPKPIAKPKPIVKKEPVVTTPIKKVPEKIVYEEERGFWSEWKWPILVGLAFLALSILCVKCYKTYLGGEGSGIKGKLTEAKNMVTGKGNEAEANVEDYLKDKPKLQKYAKFLTKEIVDEGCIIVVGTFKRARNVIKMKDKLIRAGLSPFTEPYNGMTRVGVLFPCEEHDLEGYIDTLRRSFDKNAWYLSPRMDVAKK